MAKKISSASSFFNQQNNEKLLIYTIYVTPRNQFYCRYIINESQIHTKKYEDLKLFLYTKLPDHKMLISDLLDRKRTFICFVQDNIVEELEFDFDSEMDKLKSSHRSDLLSIDKAFSSFKNETINNENLYINKIYRNSINRYNKIL